MRLKTIKESSLRNKVQNLLEQPEFIRVTIKTEIGENVDSMFIVIEEEQPETCEYMIYNESVLFDMLYKQHITVSNINIR